MLTVAEGNGPVNALDRALRKALGRLYPRLRAVHLTDYKVRILDSASGTAAMTRVLIDFHDGSEPGPPSAPAPTSSKPAGAPWPTAWNTPWCGWAARARAGLERHRFQVTSHLYESSPINSECSWRA